MLTIKFKNYLNEQLRDTEFQKECDPLDNNCISSTHLDGVKSNFANIFENYNGEDDPKEFSWDIGLPVGKEIW